jgi:hypothetical protein
MRLRLTLWLAALTIAYGPLAAKAVTPDDDCLQCKHADCIKGLIHQKQQMASGYDALAHKWDRLLKIDGAAADTINFNTIPDIDERAMFYRGLLKDFKAIAMEERDLASRVGPAAGCGPFEAEVSTDTYASCEINARSLQDAIDNAPCRQIGELMKRHETLHHDRCVARKRTGGHMWQPNGLPKPMPAVMQTPSGHAREEAEAYRMEIGVLQTLLPRAQAKCEYAFTGVTTRCRIPSSEGAVEMGQDIEGKVCGDPVTGTWTIHSSTWAHGPGLDLRYDDHTWQDDCEARGSPGETLEARVRASGPGGGWMCVYDDSDPPKVIIRNFRLRSCSGPQEQDVVRPIVRRECGDDSQAPSPPPQSDVPVS